MAKVLGNDVIVYFYIDGVWTLYACSRTITLNVVTEFIETTIVGDGAFSNFLPTKHSFTGTLEGLVDLDYSGRLTLADLRSKQLTKEKLLLRFQRTDIDGQVYTDEAYFYISETSDTSNFADVATFNVSLKGVGRITPIFTPTTIGGNKVTRLEYTATGGEMGFTDASMIGKEAIEINRDGLGNSKIILSGTPINKEALFDATTGSIEWASPLAVGEETYVLYQTP